MLPSSLQGSSQSPHSAKQVCPVLLDTERTLALLQGLRACCMAQGIPVIAEEEENEKWLSLEIFASGYETQPLSSLEPHLTNKTLGAEVASRHPPAFQRQTSYDVPRSFVCSLMHPEIQDEKVAIFLSVIHRYCQQKHLTIALSEQNPDHPIEKFGRLFMGCLIKLHDLVPVALGVVEQETGPNNEQDPNSLQLPLSLADICKLVYDAKVALVKAHQESSCTYEEVCRDPINRCRFMINNIRSPMLNVVNVLHRNRIQVIILVFIRHKLLLCVTDVVPVPS